jgi:iron-sulfur cluster repair protein YtfE (RIC family)
MEMGSTFCTTLSQYYQTLQEENYPHLCKEIEVAWERLQDTKGKTMTKNKKVIIEDESDSADDDLVGEESKSSSHLTDGEFAS